MKKFLLSFVCLMTVSFVFAETYSYEFTAKQFTANGTKELGGLTWTLAGECVDGGYWGFDSNSGRGQQFGSGSKPYTLLTLSTNSLADKTITEIVINTSGAASIDASLSVKVGETSFTSNENESISLTKSATDYAFTGIASGNIELKYVQTTSKAIYIKSLQLII